MRKFGMAVVMAVIATIGITVPAFAGNPHFVDDQLTASVSGNTLTVSGKEAGLGDELQVHIVLTADAQCVNPGGNDPQADNKDEVTVAGDFPVQNGKAYFTLTVTAVFDPSSPCPGPMNVVFSNITVTDTTNGISATL